MRMEKDFMNKHMLAKIIDSISDTCIWMDDMADREVIIADKAPVHSLIRSTIDMLASELKISPLTILYFCGVEICPDEIDEDIKNNIDKLERLYLEGKEEGFTDDE